MDEQRDLMAREEQVRTAREVSTAESKAMSRHMKSPSHFQFGSRVPRLHLGHNRASLAAVYLIGQE